MKARPILTKTLHNSCIIPINYPARKNNGYIVVERDNKTQYLHRYLYEIKYGPLKKNQVVRHLCNNSSCINLNHLKCGTQKDNIHDQIFNGTFVCGEKNGCAKLTSEEVFSIRNSRLSIRELSIKYNISKSNIYSILGKRTWKHLLNKIEL